MTALLDRLQDGWARLAPVAWPTLRMLAQVIGITVIVFFLVRVIPGDVVDFKAIEGDLSLDQQAELRRELGLDRTWPEQLVRWIGNAATGELGLSARFGKPVWDMLALAVPVTLKLAAYGLAAGLALGIAAAIGAALFPRSPFVWMVNVLNIWSISMPTFCIGVALILVFVIALGWMQIYGNFLLATAVLGVDIAGQIAKPLHEDLKEGMTAHYVRTARAKGLGRLRIVMVHVLPNALTTVLALGGIILASLIGGAITMEVLFALPGVGTLALTSIKGRDYPLIQAVIVFLAVAVVFANFVTDMLQRLIDPRLRKR